MSDMAEYRGGSQVAEREPQGADRDGGGAWYACYTRARHEKRVRSRLSQRGFGTYLPLVSRVRQWHDREKVVEFPMFPGYVFARFRLEALHWVLGTPGVSTIVSFNGSPVPIADEEIDNVRRFASGLSETDSDPEPEPLIPEGEAVTVVSGPFAGVTGRVIEYRSRDRMLIQVGLEAIRQGLRVEVDPERVEVLEPTDV